MTVWSWLRFTITLWLLRKAIKLTGWLLLALIINRRANTAGKERNSGAGKRKWPGNTGW